MNETIENIGNMPNTLFYGDNLEILRHHLADESVDLVYLDPPFNSKADYNILFKERSGEPSGGQIKAFSDTWHWSERTFNEFVESCPVDKLVTLIEGFVNTIGRNDVTAYLTMMAPRLQELHRVLKPTGSLYLHCDPTASHYLKLILDCVFGPEYFRNEIIWRRTGSHNSAKRFGPIHDVLLYFVKSTVSKFRKIFSPYTKGHVKAYFRKSDENGFYWTNTITGAGIRHGESGCEWRGYNPTQKNRHWAIPGKIIEALGIDPTLSVIEKLEALYESGVIDFPDGNGFLPTYRQYLQNSHGIPIQDIWTYQPHTQGLLHNSDKGIDEDVRWLVAQGSKERLGYPTQKPLGLLERIISSSSIEGDVVLDPFCGCGTAIVAAQKLKRSWIGIDITHLAISLIKYRLTNSFPDLKEGQDYFIKGEPTTASEAEVLAKQDRYEFEKWAISLVPRAFPFQDKKGVPEILAPHRSKSTLLPSS